MFLSRFFKLASQDMAIDLGTANTVVYVRDHGIKSIIDLRRSKPDAL